MKELVNCDDTFISFVNYRKQYFQMGDSDQLEDSSYEPLEFPLVDLSGHKIIKNRLRRTKPYIFNFGLYEKMILRIFEAGLQDEECLVERLFQGKQML